MIEQSNTVTLCPYRCPLIIVQTDPMVKSTLSDLHIKCYYAVQGCNEEVPYDVIDKHEKTCAYKLHPCLLCKKKFYFEPHDSVCLLRGKPCAGCKLYFSSDELRNHEKICGDITVISGCCRKMFTRRNILFHSELSCFRQMVAKLNSEKKKKQRENELQTIKLEKSVLEAENEILKKDKSCILAQLFPGKEPLHNELTFHREKCHSFHVLIPKDSPNMISGICIQCNRNISINEEPCYVCKAEGFSRYLCAKCY